MRASLPVALALVLGACGGKPPEKASNPPEYFKVDRSTAAVISGRVSFQGKAKPAASISMDADTECVRLNPTGLKDESLLVNRDGTLRNVLVYVKQGLQGKTFPKPAEPVVLDQKGCRFDPRVFALQSGQTLKVTNSDPVTHNIHPQAQLNREWNQSQAPGDPPLERRFARPEVVIRVKCNIHSWMRSWAAVLDHPYFAVTGTQGTFEIADLPPGEYILEAWHEILGVQTVPVSVQPSSKSNINFTFSDTQKQ